MDLPAAAAWGSLCPGPPPVATQLGLTGWRVVGGMMAWPQVVPREVWAGHKQQVLPQKRCQGLDQAASLLIPGGDL